MECDDVMLDSILQHAYNLASALKILPDCEIYRVQQSSLFAGIIASVTTTAGIRVAFRCAMCLASLHTSPQAIHHHSASIKLFNELSLSKHSLHIAAVSL